MLKAYLKPEFTRVEMRPVEAGLYACKNISVVTQAWLGGSGLCAPGGNGATDACKQVTGS
jgi:hypothetical protein